MSANDGDERIIKLLLRCSRRIIGNSQVSKSTCNGFVRPNFMWKISIYMYFKEEIMKAAAYSVPTGGNESFQETLIRIENLLRKYIIT